MKIQPDAVRQAEEALEEGDAEGALAALPALLSEYRKAKRQYNYLRHHGQPPEPDPAAPRPDTYEVNGEPLAESRNGQPADEEDRLMKVDEAAEILGVKKRWLYDRSDSLPFAKKLAPRTLRFSEAGLREWIETRP